MSIDELKARTDIMNNFANVIAVKAMLGLEVEQVRINQYRDAREAWLDSLAEFCSQKPTDDLPDSLREEGI